MSSPINRLLFALMACCAALAQAEQPPAIWRGNFIAGTRGLQMSPCRSGERLALEDRTPKRELEAVYRELAQRPGRAIFLEFAGQRDGPVLRAERFIRAYAEGPGCREDLGTVRLRANGADPPWHLDARGDAVLLRRLGVQEPSRFPAGPFERRGAQFVYEGAAEKSVLRVTVRDARCRDPLSGALTTLSAVADWDGRKLSGCAYWGDLAPQ